MAVTSVRTTSRPEPTAKATTPDVPEATRLVVYPRLGNPEDSQLPLRPPGTLLLSGGGGHIPDAYRWMHQQLTGDPTRKGGDVVVVRATLDDTYSAEFLKSAPFNSVQTIAIPEKATPEELRAAAEIISKAEGVFFSGGKQSRYVAWRDTPVMQAVQAVYDKGGCVGGTSAGLAILGERIFDGRKAPSSEVTTKALLAHPDNPKVTMTEDLFEFPPLDDALTDTHFRERDRFGRLVTFMARQPDGRILGVGVDEQTAVCIDRQGVGHLARNRADAGAAYLVKGKGDQVQSGQPLGPITVHVTRLDGLDQASRFDFRTWQGQGCAEYDVTVDGSKPQPCSVDPYTGEKP